jgi:UDP-N-acetyl-D-mannosaminuronic acid dehydrogenase
LSYKLKRILEFRAQSVLCTDPYVSVDANLESLEYVLANSDLLVIAAPHKQYRDLETVLPVADVWNLLGQGTVV